jgi:hypothetical protein
MIKDIVENQVQVLSQMNYYFHQRAGFDNVFKALSTEWDRRVADQIAKLTLSGSKER